MSDLDILKKILPIPQGCELRGVVNNQMILTKSSEGNKRYVGDEVFTTDFNELHKEVRVLAEEEKSRQRKKDIIKEIRGEEA